MNKYSYSNPYWLKLETLESISKKSFSVYKEGEQHKLRFGLYNLPSSFPFTFDDTVEI